MGVGGGFCAVNNNNDNNDDTTVGCFTKTTFITKVSRPENWGDVGQAKLVERGTQVHRSQVPVRLRTVLSLGSFLANSLGEGKATWISLPGKHKCDAPSEKFNMVQRSAPQV